MDSTYAHHIRPRLALLLKKLKLDYQVEKSSGCCMHISEANGSTKRVLDLVGGYGSCLLGHNHPELVNTLIESLQRNTSVHAQLSLREPAGKLGERLDKLAQAETGNTFITTLVNTGAEAVEAAMKHALLACENRKQKFLTQGLRTFTIHQSKAAPAAVKAIQAAREEWLTETEKVLQQHPPVFVALKGAFHGKTLGALSLTHNPVYRTGFEGALAKCHFIDPEAPDFQELLSAYHFPVPSPELVNGSLEMNERQWHPIVALFAEPIQGEAGVIPLAPQLATELRNFCTTLGIPLVWDEIQSGCFRTGSLFASSRLGVPGDYYLLGKSLGGGLVKTAALLIEKGQYEPNFGLLHTSTFAEDELSSEVACRFLDIAQDSISSIDAEAGVWKQMLSRLADEFPEVIKEVRGKGLMYGIEFRDFFTCGYYGFQAVSRGGYFSYLVAAWLFHHHGIRFSAPLSNGHTLRLHPALGCTGSDVQQVSDALTELCQILSCFDFYALVSFLLPAGWQNMRARPLAFPAAEVEFEPPLAEAARAGFITHYINETTLLETDPSLAGLPLWVIEDLLSNFQELLSPVITGGRNIIAATGQAVHLTMVGSPFTAGMGRRAIENCELVPLRNTLGKAVTLLEESSPAVIGLGQYTSIIAGNGLYLKSLVSAITSGNGLTAYFAAEAFLSHCKTNLVSTQAEKLAVFGAAGNIGFMFCSLLAPKVKELVLFGSPGEAGKRKLGQVISALTQLAPNTIISIADNPRQAATCRLVLSATSHPEAFLSEEHLHPEAIICEVSVPQNISPSVIANPGSRTIIPGGFAWLPDGGKVPTKGFPLPCGQTYACLAETLILALANQPGLASAGELKLGKVIELAELAQLFGFSAHAMAQLK